MAMPGVWPRLRLRQILQDRVATIRIAASELDPNLITKSSGGRRASPRASTTKRR